MATTNEETLVSLNAAYAAAFKDGDLALPPSRKLAVVTCMDARIDPAAAFGIPLGGAHIIRNAGGSAPDALRSLIISQQLLGTDEVYVIKHTDCGMLTFKNADAHGVVEKSLGPEASKEISGLDFLPFPSLEEEAKKDVQWIKAQKALGATVKVTGWVYDVGTGLVKKVT